MTDFSTRDLHITMPDGSVWAVSMSYIAEHKARHYSKSPGDFAALMSEKKQPLFSCDGDAIDWAENNMNWCDIKRRAFCITPANVDFEDGWVNGEKSVEDAS